MQIHEYQAKKILREYGVPLLNGGVAYTAEEAYSLAKDLGGNVFAIKAQIHAGGRGKGGGVKIAKSLEDVKELARQMIGMRLVTPQTTAEGQEVSRVYIEQGCQFIQEIYFSLLIDRSSAQIVAVASMAGGVNIETAAEEDPEKIQTTLIDPFLGLQSYHARKLAFALGLKGKAALKIADTFQKAYKAFMAYDGSLLEINPLVITAESEAIALDAKMTFDDNALYRQPEIEKLRDITEEDPIELEATKNSLSYIKLDGNIGCLVNGAGLAMATMDVIKLYGGAPANFLDVGGGAPKERVATAFKLILSDPHVEGILVNIFGGIMRCDIIAEGIIAAAKEIGMNVPLVVRLEGTNVQLGKKILNNSELSIIAADDLGSAAERIVQAVKEVA